MEENANMEKMVQDHERRIADLERQHGEIKNEIKAIQGSQWKIENTVLTESKEQKELLNKLVDHHLNTKTTNLNNRWKLLFQVMGVGGIIYLVLDFLLTL